MTQDTSEGERLTRLEATVDYLVREVGDIKADIRLLRTEMNGVRGDMRETRDAIEMVRQDSRRDFRWIIGTFIAVMVPTWVFIAGTLFTRL